MFGSKIPIFDKLLDEISLKSSKAEIMPVPFKSSSGFSNSSKIEGKPISSILTTRSSKEISNCASLSPRCVSATITRTSISNVNSSRPRLPVIKSAKIPTTESYMNRRKIQNVPFLQHEPGLFLKPHTKITCHDSHLERCVTKSERFERLATSKDSAILETESDRFLMHLDSASPLKTSFTCEDEHPSKAQKEIISNESKLTRNATKCKSYIGCSADETSSDADSEYRASPVPKKKKKTTDKENTPYRTNCVQSLLQMSLFKSDTGTFSNVTKPRRSSTTETFSIISDTEKRRSESPLQEDNSPKVVNNNIKIPTDTNREKKKFDSETPNFDKLLDEKYFKSARAEIMPVPFTSSPPFNILTTRSSREISNSASKTSSTCEDEHTSKAQHFFISNESKLKRNATKFKTYNGCSAEETSFDADSKYRTSPVPKREKKPIDGENTSSDTNCVETSSQISLCKSVSATFSRSESSLQEASPAHSSRSESSKTSLSFGYNSDVLTKPRRSSTTPETLNSDTEKRNNKELSPKEKLKVKILQKRDVKKEEEIKVEFTTKTFEMTYPELRKRERKREQNKRSARKSRDKQKQNEDLVQKKYQDVSSKHHTLQSEMQQLKSEKKHLCTTLIHHLKNECKLKQREEHLERIKKLPVSIISSSMACRGLEKPSANFVTAGLQDTTIRKSNDKCERGNKL